MWTSKIWCPMGMTVLLPNKHNKPLISKSSLSLLFLFHRPGNQAQTGSHKVRLQISSKARFKTRALPWIAMPFYLLNTKRAGKCWQKEQSTLHVQGPATSKVSANPGSKPLMGRKVPRPAHARASLPATCAVHVNRYSFTFHWSTGMWEVG